MRQLARAEEQVADVIGPEAESISKPKSIRRRIFEWLERG
jgi:hypothetical protein